MDLEHKAVDGVRSLATGPKGEEDFDDYPDGGFPVAAGQVPPVGPHTQAVADRRTPTAPAMEGMAV